MGCNPLTSADTWKRFTAVLVINLDRGRQSLLAAGISKCPGYSVRRDDAQVSLTIAQWCEM